MIQKGNFLLLKKEEFREWLKQENVTRVIKTLQVHHTSSPNYTTRKVINGIANQDKFVCLEGMRNYHVNNNKWRATGQNITVFEDGDIAISLDRTLNETPAGITGHNSKSVCIEIIGDFDLGKDMMTSKQRDSIIYLYACLCEKFDIDPDENTIIYHAWFTNGGTKLGTYIPGKSVKSCPGTNFFGGNTKESSLKYFIPLIKDKLNRLKGSDILELTIYQWSELKNNVEELIKRKVVNSTDWLNKIDDKSLTNSELNWLNNMVIMRLLK